MDMILFISIKMGSFKCYMCCLKNRVHEGHLRIKNINKPKQLTRDVLVHPQVNTNFEEILQVYCTNQENQVT